MTSEEKLKKWYEECKAYKEDGVVYSGSPYKNINPEHIDLIANLVVERLKKDA